MTEREAFVDRYVREAMNHYGWRDRRELEQLVAELARRLYDAEHRKQGEHE